MFRVINYNEETDVFFEAWHFYRCGSRKSSRDLGYLIWSGNNRNGKIIPRLYPRHSGGVLFSWMEFSFLEYVDFSIVNHYRYSSLHYYTLKLILYKNWAFWGLRFFPDSNAHVRRSGWGIKHVIRHVGHLTTNDLHWRWTWWQIRSSSSF